MRLKRPLAAPSGLRRVGRNVLNTQLLEGAAYLRQVGLVDLATGHRRGEVARTPVGVKAGEQAITDHRLADAVKA
ncbi:MAG: hypothetical protein Q7T46_01475 [Polaromonas sp.]|nr:hypothetical protein [Polaromonas sp.]